MGLEDTKIVYKKHFRGKEAPGASAEKLNRYCDAQPIYESLISQLGLNKSYLFSFARSNLFAVLNHSLDGFKFSLN